MVCLPLLHLSHIITSMYVNNYLIGTIDTDGIFETSTCEIECWRKEKLNVGFANSFNVKFVFNPCFGIWRNSCYARQRASQIRNHTPLATFACYMFGLDRYITFGTIENWWCGCNARFGNNAKSRHRVLLRLLPICVANMCLSHKVL